jgi:BirA family biotin operon repressor/biotin-[acetyl-CoA-carboxylase] ligase
LLSSLRTERLGKSLLILDECASTNTLAFQLAEEGVSEGFMILTEKQTKGKGRHGRVWLSPPGGIWMSVVLRPPRTFEPLEGIPTMAALAVVKSINSIHGIKTHVKWPNDVVFNGRKLGGTLVETRLAGDRLRFAILGIGVNVNFPSSLLTGAGNVATILETVGHEVDRVELASRILFEFEHIYDDLLAGKQLGVLNLLKMNDATKGKVLSIELENERIYGTFDGYSTLTKVRIINGRSLVRQIETSSVVSVAFQAA